MSLTVEHRRDLREGVWDAFVDQNPGGWFWHTSHWIDYCLAYHPGAVDDSFAVVYGDRVVGLCPMVREGDRYAMGGNPGADPLISAPMAIYALVSRCMQEHVEVLARSRGVASVAFRAIPRPVKRYLEREGWEDISWDTLVLDLRPEEVALWTGVRKSYKSLIRKTERTRDIRVLNQPWAVSSVAKVLHYAAAGRATRPDRTWELMAEWCTQGFGVVALASGVADPDPESVGRGWDGYAYAIRYKGHAYYASGATTAPDIAHALQWALIKTLRCDGRLTYELGWMVRPGDSPKDAAISFFKAGFAGAVWPIAAVKRTFE